MEQLLWMEPHCSVQRVPLLQRYSSKGEAKQSQMMRPHHRWQSLGCVLHHFRQWVNGGCSDPEATVSVGFINWPHHSQLNWLIFFERQQMRRKRQMKGMWHFYSISHFVRFERKQICLRSWLYEKRRGAEENWSFLPLILCTKILS